MSRSRTSHRGNLLAIFLPLDLANEVPGAIGFRGDAQGIFYAKDMLGQLQWGAIVLVNLFWS